jgi:hypothetical protein
VRNIPSPRSLLRPPNRVNRRCFHPARRLQRGLTAAPRRQLAASIGYAAAPQLTHPEKLASHSRKGESASSERCVRTAIPARRWFDEEGDTGRARCAPPIGFGLASVGNGQTAERGEKPVVFGNSATLRYPFPGLDTAFPKKPAASGLRQRVVEVCPPLLPGRHVQDSGSPDG